MSTARWSAPGFAEEVRALVREVVGEPSSVELVRQRPWSVVWRARVDGTTWYVKDNCSSQAHESALLERLAEVAPGRALGPAGVRGSRFVAPDLGEPVGERADGDLDLWSRIVVAAAELQREVAPYADGLGLVAIVPDVAADWTAGMVEHLASRPTGDPRRLPEDDADALRALDPTIRGWAEQVAALGLPPTLVHNDLHAHNVFAVEDRMVLFDLGDALVMEPLAGLLVPLNVLAHQLGAGPEDPRLARVADAGLEVWSDLAPMAELRTALPAALQLGRLGRVESWHRIAADLDGPDLDECGEAAAGWLALLLEDPPVGALRA